MGIDVNIIKSLLMLLFLIILSIGSIIAVVFCIHIHRYKKLSMQRIIFTGILCIITIVIVACFGDYAYPLERTVEFELIAELDIPPENAFNPEFPHFWHAAYEQFGLYSDSFYFSEDYPYSYLGFKWPEMDFKNHTYIITYCQELESLTYNVWETIDIPIRTGAKAGYAVLSEEIDPCKVYVYEIPKIRIENDINFTTEYVREKMKADGKPIYY